MNEALRKLSYQELFDRLAKLTARLSSGRGMDKSHEFCIIDIEELQAEILSRREIQLKKTVL